MESNQFKSVIQAINNGQQFPAINLVRSNSALAATASKLITPRNQQRDGALKTASETQSARTLFEAKSLAIARKTTDAETAMQLFPELELSAQILISSIISPKDMSTGEIIYTAPDGLLTPEVSAACITRVREYFETDYKIKPLLPKLLREVLFETGSYPIAVLPESSIDDIINGFTNPSMESMSEFVSAEGVPRNTGYLGSPYSQVVVPIKPALNFCLESFSEKALAPNYDSTVSVADSASGGRKKFAGGYLHVTDNPNALKIPMAIKAANTFRAKSILSNRVSNMVRGVIKTRTGMGVGTESFAKSDKRLTGTQIKNLVYKNKMQKTVSLVRVKTAEQASRRSVGSPLVLRLPSESVIPVHVPGNEEQHVGFFVLLDMDGNPVKHDQTVTNYGALNGGINGNELQSVLLERANHNLNSGDKFNDLTYDQGSQIYTDIVETDLRERLANGIYGKNVTLAKNSEVYRIMLARALSNQYSQLLYLPAELVTYFAYKYNKDGVGKSLLDDMRILNSLRAMTMFARVMASIKNSIGVTEVKLKLDENDPDPQKSIETAIHEIAKTRGQKFPLGITAPADLVDWTQRAAYQYTFEGHPGIPDVNISFEEKSSNYVKPDNELDEELKKRVLQGLGLSPETVDNGFSAEFATTAVANNLLLSKRVTQIQEHIVPLLTDHARKVSINDANLFDDLHAIIEQNYDKLSEALSKDDDFKNMEKDAVIHFLTDWFMNNFELTLPQPDSVTLETQMMAFDTYSEALGKALDAWISSEIMNSGMSGEVASQADALKAIIKAHYLRKWMAENNVLTELAELTTVDEDGNPNVDMAKIQADHIAAFEKTAMGLLEKLKENAKKNDAKIEEITGGEGLPDSGTGGGSDDGGSSDDGLGLGDDFGLGEDLGGADAGGDGTDPAPGEEPAADDAPAEEDAAKKEDGEEDPTRPADKLPDLGEQK